MLTFSGPVNVGIKNLHALCTVIYVPLKQFHVGVSVNIALVHAQSRSSQQCRFTCVGFVNI